MSPFAENRLAFLEESLRFFDRNIPACRLLTGRSEPGEAPGGDVSLLLPMPVCIINAGARRRLAACLKAADSVFFTRAEDGLCITFSVADGEAPV